MENDVGCHLPGNLIILTVRREPFQGSPCHDVAPVLAQVANLAQAYYGGSGATISLWSYIETPLVHE